MSALADRLILRGLAISAEDAADPTAALRRALSPVTAPVVRRGSALRPVGAPRGEQVAVSLMAPPVVGGAS